MSKQDVLKALETMDEEALRAQLAESDFSVLGDTELTDDEGELVRAAAEGFPETQGFAFGDLRILRVR